MRLRCGAELGAAQGRNRYASRNARACRLQGGQEGRATTIEVVALQLWATNQVAHILIGLEGPPQLKNARVEGPPRFKCHLTGRATTVEGQ
eukprot:288351-Chlamydomonas_euryale.AAC.2